MSWVHLCIFFCKSICPFNLGYISWCNFIWRLEQDFAIWRQNFVEKMNQNQTVRVILYLNSLWNWPFNGIDAMWYLNLWESRTPPYMIKPGYMIWAAHNGPCIIWAISMWVRTDGNTFGKDSEHISWAQHFPQMLAGFKCIKIFSPVITWIHGCECFAFLPKFSIITS